MEGFTNPVPSLTLRLFGAFEIGIHGAPLPHTRSAKDRWLLALLALQGGRPVTRAWLAEMLWPQDEYSPGQSRGYLRRSLMGLRKAMGDEAERLETVDLQHVRLNVEGADVDVANFDAAIEKGDPTSLSAAIALYRGPLLSECIEPWVTQEREARSERYRKALNSLAEAAIEARRDEEAIGLLRRAVQVDPLDEGMVCRLLRLLAACGDFNGAMHVYSGLRDALQRNGIPLPNADTMALYNEIRRNSREKAKAALNQPAPSVTLPPLRSTPAVPVLRRSTLPVFLTAVVGREREMERIEAQFETRRVITLLGPGGVGKTRLAVYAAERLGSLCADGCVFVDLVTVQEESRIAWAIASAAGLEPQGSVSMEEVAALLRDREMLMILDNCEHLQAACAGAARILVENCPALHLIATSRRPLDIIGEAIHHVRPLALASADSLGRLDEDLISLVAESAAVRLFMDRAVDVVGEIALTPQNVRMIDGLCRRLDGIPLALELAAARLRSSTVPELYGQIEGRLTALDDRRRAPRHRRLRAVIDWSYDLLSADERAMLISLSVFRGGTTRDAVKGICETWIGPGADSRALLESMVDHSLVTLDDVGAERRFRMLEIIRQYAGERLEEECDVDEQSDLKKRHADWYSRLAKSTDRDLYHAQQVEAVRRLNEEQDNCMAAIEQYLSARDGQRAVALCASLAQYWHMRGLYPQVEKMAEDALKLSASNPSPERARILALASFHADGAGDAERALRFSAEALEYAEKHADPGMLSVIMQHRAWTLRHADPLKAEEMLDAAARLSEKAGDPWHGAEILSTLGFLCLYRNQKDAAEHRFQAGLKLAMATGDRWIRAELLYHLGMLYAERGSLADAFTLFEQALEAQSELGDRVGISVTFLYLAEIALRGEEILRAATYFKQSLAASRELEA